VPVLVDGWAIHYRRFSQASRALPEFAYRNERTCVKSLLAKTARGCPPALFLTVAVQLKLVTASVAQPIPCIQTF
jgi:hypothetical protein